MNENCNNINTLINPSVISTGIQTTNVHVVDHQAQDDQKDISRQKYLFKWQKYIYTLIHFYIHLTFGLTTSSMSPAFVDFSHLLNTSMAMIGLFPTFQAVGTLAGSIVVISYKWLNRQLVLTLLTMGMGLTTIFMPYTTQLWQLYLCIFIYGMGIGVWNGANNVVLIEMWQQRSPSMLQFAQFTYGVGTILGPLMVQNFVLGNMICPGIEPQDCDVVYNNQTLGTTLEPNSVCSESCLTYDRRPRLKIPYLIGGLLMLIGPTTLFVMYFVRRYQFINDGEVEVVSTPEQKARYKKYVPKKFILTAIAIYFAFGMMSENMTMDFIPTFFQYQPTLRVPASKASDMFSTVSASLTIGRFISIFVAMYVKPEHMIIFQFCVLIFGWIFIILGQNTLVLLWISADIIGLGLSSLFICMFSFVGKYMEVTDRVGGLFIGSYNVIYLFLPYFLGELIPLYPSGYLYIEIFCVCIGFIAFLSAFISVRNVPKDLIRKMGPIGGH